MRTINISATNILLTFKKQLSNYTMTASHKISAAKEIIYY